MTSPPHHQGHQREPKNRPWNRADANCERHATLPMARLPNTPRPPQWAPRIPASVWAEATVKRPPVPANRAVATRGDANERAAKLRPANARPAMRGPPKRATLKEWARTLDPPKRATPKERAPTPAPPKRATPKERAPPKAPPRAPKPIPPPCPPKPPWPPKPPPCPPKPPRASASSVKSGTARSKIAAVQTPAIDTGRVGVRPAQAPRHLRPDPDTAAERAVAPPPAAPPRSAEPWHISTDAELQTLTWAPFP